MTAQPLLEAVAVLDVADLLETQAETERAITWDPGWSGRALVVRGPEHLSVLVSTLGLSDFGGVRREGDPRPRWTQTKRMPQGWIVEVCDCPTDEWPSRAYRGTAGTYLREVLPRVHFGAEYFPPGDAADLMWSWLRGNLPEGVALARAVD